MSPKKTVLAAGLVAMGLAGVASVTGADRPPAPELATTPGPAPSAPAPAVLLLSNGTVVQGSISETDEGYVVTTRIGGELNYRRHQVAGVFPSLREAYGFRRGRTPGNDPDEKMKLALWCLSQQLYDEAQVELKDVLRLSPGYERARQMLYHLQSQARRTQTADSAVMRSSGERVEEPRTISTQTLQELREAARRNPAVAATAPIIFDLPRPMAIKRYQDFASYVHPELQRRCATCHNEQSSTSFQLVQARARSDYANELLVRTNLDATLRLVDPADPTRSVLLSSTINPHKPNGRPILSGPNDVTYRMLLQWVSSLRSPTAGSHQAQGGPDRPVAPAVYAPGSPVPASTGGFGSDRLDAGPGSAPVSTPAAAVSPPGLGPTATPNLDPDPVVPRAAGQLLPGSATGMTRTLPPPEAFAPPPRPGEPNPDPALQPAGAPPATVATPKKEAGKTIRVPGLGDVPLVDIRELDAADARSKKAGAPTSAQGNDPTAKKKPSLNTDALQKFMLGRPR